jgi:Right handed beta helix region
VTSRTFGIASSRLPAITTVQVPPPTGIAVVDTALIAGSIAALPATGGLVQLQAGTYVLSAPAVASSGAVSLGVNNSTLAGRGIGVTTLKLADGTSASCTGIVRTPTGVQNSAITFRDFTIDGNKANVTGTPTIIGVYAGVSPQSTQTDLDIAFIGVEVKNCTDYGFDPHERVTRLRIVDCISHDNGQDGITVDGCYDWIVQGCTAYSNGRHGFNFVTASQRGRVIGCYAYSNGSNGFTAQNGAKHITFEGCRSYGNTGVGYLIDGVPQSSPQLDTDPGGRCTLTGCTATASGSHGFQLNGAANCTLTGCRSFDASTTTNNGASHLKLSESGSNYAANNTIVGFVWGQTGAVANAAKYGVEEQTSSDGPNYVLGSSGSGTITGAMNLLHATSAVAAAHNGSSGQHPATFAYAADAPSRHGLIEWNFTPDIAGSSSGVALVAGTIYGLRIDVQAGQAIHNIVVVCGSAASGLTSGQCIASIINSSGVEQARSADISGSFGSTGVVTIPLAAAFTPAAGATLAVLLLFNGTTPPSLVRSSGTGVTAANVGMTSTSPRRYFTAGTSQTSMPSSVTMSGTSANGAFTLWCGLS